MNPGDYHHFNVNVQMNYWPVYATNLAECGTTFVARYMDKLREPGRLTAESAGEGTVKIIPVYRTYREQSQFGAVAPTNAHGNTDGIDRGWAIKIFEHYELHRMRAYPEEYDLSDYERGSSVLGFISLDIGVSEN